MLGGKEKKRRLVLLPGNHIIVSDITRRAVVIRYSKGGGLVPVTMETLGYREKKKGGGTNVLFNQKQKWKRSHLPRLWYD